MRYSVLALANGSILAAAAIVGLRLHSHADAAPRAVDAPAVEAFQLQANGEAEDCTVEKTAGAGPLSRVTVAPACDQVLPGLSSVQYWQEGADGTVTWSADGTTASVVFGVGDGVAYESVEPRIPVLALIASN